jgi:hypothetical protein
MLHPKTNEHVNPSVEVHHFVGKLFMAETLLTEVPHKVPTCAGKHLFVIMERLHAHPVLFTMTFVSKKLCFYSGTQLKGTVRS